MSSPDAASVPSVRRRPGKARDLRGDGFHVRDRERVAMGQRDPSPARFLPRASGCYPDRVAGSDRTSTLARQIGHLRDPICYPVCYPLPG